MALGTASPRPTVHAPVRHALPEMTAGCALHRAAILALRPTPSLITRGDVQKAIGGRIREVMFQSTPLVITRGDRRKALRSTSTGPVSIHAPRDYEGRRRSWPILATRRWFQSTPLVITRGDALVAGAAYRHAPVSIHAPPPDEPPSAPLFQSTPLVITRGDRTPLPSLVGSPHVSIHAPRDHAGRLAH